jgi:hypothetical protein
MTMAIVTPAAARTPAETHARRRSRRLGTACSRWAIQTVRTLARSTEFPTVQRAGVQQQAPEEAGELSEPATHQPVCCNA